MTDKQALETLESWLLVAYQNNDGTDESSAELYESLQTVFNLINRQQAEIERLKKDKSEVSFKHYNDGIKEFAERLKEKLQWDVEYDNKLVFESDIDNLLKEMVGDAE